MRSVFGWSVLSIAMLFATMSASNRANAAVLNLVVDPTTKTLWFNGSDSGPKSLLPTPIPAKTLFLLRANAFVIKLSTA